MCRDCFSLYRIRVLVSTFFSFCMRVVCLFLILTREGFHVLLVIEKYLDFNEINH